jgi:CHAT domain-containing protein
MKHLKFILPVLFILLIFNYSYAQLSQRSKVDSTIEGTRLFERGKNFFSHGEIDLAQFNLQLARKTFNSSNNICAVLATDTWIAKINVFQGEYQRAISLLENTKSLLKSYDCLIETSDFKDLDELLDGLYYHSKGMDLVSQSKTHDALISLEKARNIYQELGEEELRGLVIYQEGQAYRDIKDYEKALVCFKQVLQLSDSLDHLGGKMSALGNIGYCYAKKGEHEKAKCFLEDSLTCASKMNNGIFNSYLFESLAGLFSEIARDYETRGKYKKALMYYEYSLKFYTFSDNAKLKKLILYQMGMICQKIFQFEKSLDYYHQCLLITRSLKDIREEEFLLIIIAYAYQRMDQYENSTKFFNQALRLNRKTNNFDFAKNALFGVGLNSFANRKTNDAIDQFNNLLSICEQSNDRVLQRETLSMLSVCFKSIKALDKAIEYEKQVLNISGISDFKEIAKSSERLSNLYWEYGKTDLALQFWLNALKSYVMLGDYEETINFYNRAALKSYTEKYQTASKYLKNTILSAKKDGSLKKEILINLLLADLNYYADKSREAITYYKKGYNLNKRLHDPNIQKAILYGMIQCFLEQDNPTLELNCYKEILQLANETKDIGLRLDAFEHMATFRFIMGQPRKAIDMLDLGLRIAEASGEERKQGDYYNDLSMINFMLGNFHKTIDFAMKAIDIYQEFGEFEKELLALNRIAGAYMRLNDLEKSVTYSNEALNGYIRAKNFDGAMHSLLDLAYINWELSNNHLANYFLEKAYTILSNVKYQDTVKRLSFITGLVLEKMGFYEQALFHLSDSLQWAQFKGRNNIYNIIENYGAIALTYFDMGDQEKAGIYGEKVKALTAKSGYLWAKAFFLNYYSLVPLKMNNYSEALVILTTAKKIFREMGNVKGEIENLLFTTHVLSEQLSKTKKHVSEEDYGNIFNYLIEALNLSKNIGDKGNEATALTMLGSNYYNVGKYTNAEMCLQDAKNIAEQHNIPELVVTANHYLGKVYERKGKYVDALNCYQEAVKTIETLRRWFSLSVFKSKFLEKRREVYDSYFSLLLRLHKLNPTQDFKSKAFTICEKAKARCLLDSLSSLRNRDLINKKEILLSKDTITKIKILKEKLQTGMYSTEQETYVKTDLAILRDALTLSKTSIKELAQPQTSAMEPPIPDIQYTQVQSLLDKNSLFVEYALSEDKLYEWVITNDKFEIYELGINVQSLEALVRNYGTTLRKPQLSTIDLSNHIRLGQELFKILLSPIEDEILAGKKLIVVPDGPLYYLPFETLIIPQTAKPEDGQKGTQGISYLITKTSVAYFHSGAVMASMMKKPKTSPKIVKGDYEILAFGDPIYSRKEQSEKTEVDRRSFYETRGVNFERLTYSFQEVTDIAKIFNVFPASDCINLREKATEKRVHDLDLKNYKRIHFATHGILADEITWIDQPALVLSLLETDEKYDGFLTMDEIYDLHLNADLVVLSACKTGLGEEIKGEGLVGLTHAFIHAGADSLVVSLWDVNDRSTSLLMERFYENLKTMDKSEALRQAKLDLMNGKFSASVNRGVGGITKGADVRQSYSDPFYWAPFILIGNYE